MASPNSLDQLRAYAAEVAECASGVSVPDEYAGQLGDLRQLAQQIATEIAEPLRIGVVGEFSAGKSLLLGVLLGKPNLLPTSQEPTTGNVTELRFVPAPGDSTRSAVGRVEVRFFSRADADLLGQRIVADLRTAAVSARMPAAELAELDALGAGWTPAFRDWCARAAQRDELDLRKLIRELMLLRDAAAAAPGWLGQTVQISHDQLAAILKIRYPAIEKGLPPAPAAGSLVFSDKPEDAALAATFPLVARVMLDIELPAGAWPLDALSSGQGFTLLDFPGIGGANTKTRDLFLTQRGLEDVHTILVLVSAAQAGSEAPDTFYRFLRELDRGNPDGTAARLVNRIVYCAGRFDELRFPEGLAAETSDTGHDELDDLDFEPGSRPNRMTTERLLADFPAFSALLQSGYQQGLTALRGFASSVLAIARLGLPDVPGELELKEHRGAAERRAERWQQIAEALLAEGTSRELELAGMLRGYTADGGVAQLRRLLEQHVRDNGLQLRIDMAERRLDDLDEQRKELVTLLRNSPLVANEAPSSPNVRAIELHSALRLRAQELLRDTARLRDPGQIFLEGRRSVRQDVLRKSADVVMSWPQWEAILDCVRGGIVDPSARTAGQFDADLDLDLDLDVDEGGSAPGEPAADERLPQRFGDFEESYVQSCEALRDYVCDVALAGTERWLQERSAESRDLQRRADSLLDPGARERIGRLGRHMIGIEQILRPDRMASGLAKSTKEQVVLPAVPPFPLQADQLTSWSDGAPAEEGARHFMNVLRLRGALIDAVADYELGCLDAVQDRIAKRLDDLYSQGRPAQLPDQRKFVAAVVGAGAGEAEELPDPAAALAALVRPGGEPGFGD